MLHDAAGGSTPGSRVSVSCPWQMTAVRMRSVRRRVRDRARRHLPEAAKPILRRALETADPLAVRRYRHRSGHAASIPPRRLRARIGEPDIERFMRHGAEVAEALVAVSRDEILRADRVLDFGCGCGRVLQPLLERRGRYGRLTGCDVDPEAIAWLTRSVDGAAEFARNDFVPPLPFEDESFDLVYSVSIFTHLNAQSHGGWLAELHRILRPGAVALLSIHGPHAYEGARSGGQAGIGRGLASRLARRGSLIEEDFVFEPYDDRELPGIQGAYGLTFQSHDQVRRIWGEQFDVAEIRPKIINNWQDLVVLRRP